MAEKEITISQYLELNWNDKKVSDADEKFYIAETEVGIKDFEARCKVLGHDRLMFNPEELIC